MQTDLDRHIEELRQRIDATKATVDAKAADRDADWAEANATDAIAFALNAIDEAEYATLDAVLARKNAAELAASSSLASPALTSDGPTEALRRRRDHGQRQQPPRGNPYLD